ncbi:uncharacterized protein LOC130692081 [Daphnia carinata]|uniref:uncharacterized protein LOC130692081 n=1 Tax=Daphnia carinata TaxID=120202 RepID=UPI00257E026A|nr:uncharacterized protein LOC130692081 [Daphnia carinata]
MKFLILSVILACASAQYVPYSQWSPYNPQFVNDLYSKSVDLNKDGQPDVPVYPAVPAFVPSYYPYAGLASRTGYPYPYGAPFTYPFVQAGSAVVANAEPVATKTTRTKRQVAVLPHKPSEFLNDFAFSSVDLNQDGQPDNTVFTRTFFPNVAGTGARFGYPFYPGYYPNTYPFGNGYFA